MAGPDHGARGDAAQRLRLLVSGAELLLFDALSGMRPTDPGVDRIEVVHAMLQTIGEQARGLSQLCEGGTDGQAAPRAGT